MFDGRVTSTEQSYHCPALHSREKMLLHALADVLVDWMPWPIANGHFVHLLLDIDEARLLNPLLHRLVNIGWIVRSLCRHPDDFRCIEHLRIWRATPIVACHLDALLHVLKPTARLKVLIGALVHLIPVRE